MCSTARPRCSSCRRVGKSTVQDRVLIERNLLAARRPAVGCQSWTARTPDIPFTGRRASRVCQCSLRAGCIVNLGLWGGITTSDWVRKWHQSRTKRAFPIKLQKRLFMLPLSGSAPPFSELHPRRKGALLPNSPCNAADRGVVFVRKYILHRTESSPAMRYHFNIHEGPQVFRDEEGSEFATLEAARAEAGASLCDIVSEAIRYGGRSSAWRVEIATCEGTVVGSVGLRVLES